ncbi:MAG TPA: 6-carboxytetrahydropterin synthase QueD [Victivallales bacterium]|nr:6-carboxytetrahydropterin synthase QueD [Victivallales bacterium]
MFEVEITRNFSAAHKLDQYKGDCSRLHGHNWIVKVFAQSKELDDIGIAVDFRKMKQTLDSILSSMDHHNLNEITVFKGRNPTSENLARHIYCEMSKVLNTASLKISKVSVSESQDSVASYFE